MDVVSIVTDEPPKRLTVLGISGSPRVAATDFIVRYALDYLKEMGPVDVLYFSAVKKVINFCIHDDHCVITKQGCIFKDDLGVLYSMLERADGVIIGTPVYQGTLTAQTKAMLDRCRALVARDPHLFTHKVGAAIAVGGDRNGGQELAMQTIHTFFLINSFIPVGGGAFGANIGAAIWSQDKGADGAKSDTEGHRAIHKLMQKFYALLQELP